MTTLWKQWKAAKSGLCYSSFRYSLRPLMREAHYAVYKAVQRGDIQPATDYDCADCGKPAIEYDHRDYAKPLDVEPVCRRCNLRRGAGAPYANSRQSSSEERSNG
jgi:DNA-directed RNA polymerase subunit RPC12/RpoP